MHARALQAFTYTTLDSARFDADGDGAAERIELLATVERNAAGRLLWEDGHHWAVVVRDDALTYPLVERFLPWGRAEFFALEEDADATPVIVVLTRAGSGCAEGQGSIQLSVERFSYDRVEGAFRRGAVIHTNGSGVCGAGGFDDP